MANSLHFVKDKLPVLTRLLDLLEPGGRFLLVEYDADRGNPWVPYPMSFPTWRGLAQAAGLTEPVRLATYPSRWLGGMYSALAEKR
jgi:SAM-dependent methyltransferase